MYNIIFQRKHLKFNPQYKLKPAMNLGKRKSSGGPNDPPPRWLHCPRKGAVMPFPAKFLPLKTPLDSTFNDSVPEECRFSPGMLVDGVDNLGLIIDLTKTDR